MLDLPEFADPGGRNRPLIGNRESKRVKTQEPQNPAVPPTDNPEATVADGAAARSLAHSVALPRSYAPAPLSPVVARSETMPQRAPLLLFEQVSKWYGPVIGVNQVTLEL